MTLIKKNYGRIIAAAIFLTPILILFLSTAFYYSGYSPEGTVNKGTLLEKPIELKNLKLTVDSGPLENEFPGKWSIVQFVNGDCAEKCFQTLYSSRQINIRLAKDSGRVVRYLISLDSSKLSEVSLLKIKTEYPLLHLGLIESNNLPQEVLNKLQDSPCLLYTSPSPRDKRQSRMPSSA